MHSGASGNSFDIRIGSEGGFPTTILGTVSILCLLLGSAFLAVSSDSQTRTAPGEITPGNSASSSFLDFLKSLKRSNADYWLGGVCGGLGTHSPVPAWVWRMLFLILIFCFGTGVLAYVVLWICMPSETAANLRVQPRTPIPPMPAPPSPSQVEKPTM